MYLNNDVAFYQDGTRLDKYARDMLDLSHRKVLVENHIKFEEIRGSQQERFDRAVKLTDELMISKGS